MDDVQMGWLKSIQENNPVVINMMKASKKFENDPILKEFIRLGCNDPRKGKKMDVRETETNDEGLGIARHGGSEAEFERLLAVSPDREPDQAEGVGCEVGYVTLDEEGKEGSEASH